MLFDLRSKRGYVNKMSRTLKYNVFAGLGAAKDAAEDARWMTLVTRPPFD